MGAVSDWMAQIPPHLRNLADVVQYLNEFGNNLSWGQQAGGWLVLTGDQALFRSPSREEVEGFLFGLAVGYLLLENRGVRLPDRTPPLASIHDVPLSPDCRWPSSPYG